MKPTKPISPNLLAANRANATHSTGPRTPEGKCRSALNSRKHQFFPENYAVVRLEEGKALVKLRDDLIALYRPINSQEIFAVERIAPERLKIKVIPDEPTGPPLVVLEIECHVSFFGAEPS